MKQSLISVIVPVYNTEQYLKQCVKSLLDQTYKELEIILVDDGSPDRCPAMCDEFARADNRVRVVHQANRGQAKARNTALDICEGEYIAFVDSDDWLELKAYEQMMSMMQQYDLDAVFCMANIISRGEVVEQRFHYFEEGTIKSADEIVRLTLRDKIGGQPWMKLFRKSCWQNVRFPEGRIYEDLAISFVPFINARRPVGFLDQALYNYRINPEGTSLGGNPIRQYHIFLAFLDHYNYAKENYREVEQECLANAATFAIGCYNDWLRFRYPEGKKYLPTVHSWLVTNKKAILDCTQLPPQRMLMLQLYYISKCLYRVSYMIFSPKKEER